MSDCTSSNENDAVLMWHIALEKNGSLQPIVAAKIPFDKAVLGMLLQTQHPKVLPVDYDAAVGYLFAYDGCATKPYPSVMVFRYDRRGDDNVLVDMQSEDYRAVSFAYSKFLSAK